MAVVRKSPSGPEVATSQIELSDSTVLTVDDLSEGAFLVRDGLRLSGSALVGFIDLLARPQGSLPYKEARIWYDDDQHALAVYDDQSGTILQVGQEVRFRGVNKTGGLMADGSAVYVLGAQGNRPIIRPGLATAASTSEIVGVVTQDIENNQEGWVTMIGTVGGYNTSGFGDGDILYLSTTVLGGLQNTVPTGTNVVRSVAIALNSTNNGLIGVNPFGTKYLSNLTDVNDGSSSTAGRLLVADGTYWTAATALHLEGSGSPEGVVAAPVGSTYRNLLGGAGTTLYVKESGGTGNTGWVAK